MARARVGALHEVWVACFALGCASTTTTTPQPPTVGVPRTDAALAVPTTYVTPQDAGMIGQRFQEANRMLLQGRAAEAAEAFDRIVGFEPRGTHAPPALYNGGFAHEQVGSLEEALRRYDRLAREFPDAPEVRPALTRANRILARLEDWNTLAASSQVLLARGDLTPLERIEALGAHGLALVELGRVDEGGASVNRALSVIEEQGFGDAGKLTVGLAQVYFALGEVRRVGGEAIGFMPVPTNFAEVLEQRCQSLLDAQDAYAQAMRAYDASWSAMAGYRVGGMYQQLHRDLMRVPPPASADTERRKQLFAGAMQLRYRVLLEKGLKMMDRTVAMAERTGERSDWVTRARQAKQEIERALQQSRDTLARMPFSESDLRRALEQLAGKAPPASP